MAQDRRDPELRPLRARPIRPAMRGVCPWGDAAMSAAARVLERLPRARPSGAGRWRAPCPGHQSRGLTLGIAERDGRVLLHCFAGCETGAVLSALGLELRDLFDQPLDLGAPAARSPWHPRDVLDLAMRETATVAVIASDLIERRAVAPTDWARLADAARRLRHLVETVTP